jgi:MraZ protein
VRRSFPHAIEREQFSAALFGTSEALTMNFDGQVMLTDALKAHDARITDGVAFAGLGHTFQIWEPVGFRAQLSEATGKVSALKKRLGSQTRGARE